MFSVVALGLGCPVQNIWGASFLCEARKNLPVPSMRKCCDSDMFRVHQYTNWCQWLNLTFKCTRITFFIGAGSRGAGGQLPLWRYFGPPWATFAPLSLVSWAIFGKKTLLIRRKPFFFYLIRERLFVGQQKDTSDPAKTFFLFIFIRERLFLGQKTLFRVPDFGVLGLAPPVLNKFPRHWHFLFYW